MFLAINQSLEVNNGIVVHPKKGRDIKQVCILKYKHLRKKIFYSRAFSQSAIVGGRSF